MHTAWETYILSNLLIIYIKVCILISSLLLAIDKPLENPES